MRKSLILFIAFTATLQLSAQEKFSKLYSYDIIYSNPPYQVQSMIFNHDYKMDQHGHIQNSEIEIKIDSIKFSDEDGDFIGLYLYDFESNLIYRWVQKIVNDVRENYLLWSYTYDSVGNRLDWWIHSWEKGTWINEESIRYTYDSKCNRLTYLEQDWQNSRWINNTIYLFNYDTAGNMRRYSMQMWKNDNWVNSFQLFYTYDESGNRITQLKQKWMDDSWKNESYSVTTYNGKKSMQTSIQEWNNDEWLNSYRYTTTYDTNGNKISALWQNWENDIWANWLLFEHKYDDYGNNISYSINHWDSINLNKTELYTNSFDRDGNKTSEIVESWWDSSYLNRHKSEYEFLPGRINAHGYRWNENKWIKSKYGANLNIIMQGEKKFYYHANHLQIYYSDIKGIEDEEDEIQQLKLSYLNPDSENTQIKISPSINQGNYVCTVYDLSGQEVKYMLTSTNSDSQDQQINIADLANGLYIIKVTDNTQSYYQKLIITR